MKIIGDNRWYMPVKMWSVERIEPKSKRKDLDILKKFIFYFHNSETLLTYMITYINSIRKKSQGKIPQKKMKDSKNCNHCRKI